jgi:hypothetical protein
MAEMCYLGDLPQGARAVSIAGGHLYDFPEIGSGFVSIPIPSNGARGEDTYLITITIHFEPPLYRQFRIAAASSLIYLDGAGRVATEIDPNEIIQRAHAQRLLQQRVVELEQQLQQQQQLQQEQQQQQQMHQQMHQHPFAGRYSPSAPLSVIPPPRPVNACESSTSRSSRSSRIGRERRREEELQQELLLLQLRRLRR